MTAELAYDGSFSPPVAVLPVRIASPRGNAAVLVPGLIDTGADCTLIPASLARRLALPRVGSLEVFGVGGGHATTPVYAGFIEVATLRVLARLTVLGGEVILGRDILNRVKMLLNGPRLRVRVFASPRAGR